MGVLGAQERQGKEPARGSCRSSQTSLGLGPSSLDPSGTHRPQLDPQSPTHTGPCHSFPIPECLHTTPLASVSGPGPSPTMRVDRWMQRWTE